VAISGVFINDSLNAAYETKSELHPVRSTAACSLH
jgi:hypothetical protein